MKGRRTIPLVALAEITLETHGRFSIQVSQFILEQDTLRIEGRGIYFREPLKAGIKGTIRLSYRFEGKGLRTTEACASVIGHRENRYLLLVSPTQTQVEGYQEMVADLESIPPSPGSRRDGGLTVLP